MNGAALSPEQIAEARDRHAKGESIAALALAFGVSHRTMCAAVNEEFAAKRREEARAARLRAKNLTHEQREQWRAEQAAARRRHLDEQREARKAAHAREMAERAAQREATKRAALEKLAARRAETPEQKRARISARIRERKQAHANDIADHRAWRLTEYEIEKTRIQLLCIANSARRHEALFTRGEDLARETRIAINAVPVNEARLAELGAMAEILKADVAEAERVASQERAAENARAMAESAARIAEFFNKPHHKREEQAD